MLRSGATLGGSRPRRVDVYTRRSALHRQSRLVVRLIGDLGPVTGSPEPLERDAQVLADVPVQAHDRRAIARRELDAQVASQQVLPKAYGRASREPPSDAPRPAEPRRRRLGPVAERLFVAELPRLAFRTEVRVV